MNYRDHLKTAIATAIEAGREILAIYHGGFAVDYKEDRSPLTLADKASHRIILKRLGKFDIPVLSEEGRHIPFAERSNWDRLWIVDPLDGTKEFIKKNGEFTVNIALINQGVPMMGVVLAPDREQLYFAMQGLGAYKTDDGELLQKADTDLADGSLTLNEFLSRSTRLPGNRPPGTPYTIVGSRSHATPELEAFVEAKRRECGQVEFIPAGSSLKLCLVAEGKADIYPRLGPTMEWDTAAGQAVAECAGAVVSDYESGTPLRYNRPDLLNPWFVVERKQGS